MIRILLFYLCSAQSYSAFIDEKFLSKNRKKITETIRDSDTLVHQLASSRSKKKYRLDRVDIKFEFSSELGLKLFSIGKEKSIELIWRRAARSGEIQSQQFLYDQSIAISTDASENFHQLKYQLEPILKSYSGDGHSKGKVVTRLYQDAVKLTQYAQALSSFPIEAGWYLSRLFKVYNFSISGNLLSTGISADKRIRFRFYLPSIFQPPQSRRSNRVHRRLKRFVHRKLESIRQSDFPFHLFRLDRVWTTSSLGAKLDIGVLGFSAAKGFVLEFRYDQETSSATIFGGTHGNPMNLLRSVVNLVEAGVGRQESTFPLSQVRLQTGWNASAAIGIGEFSTSKSTAYHYRR